MAISEQDISNPGKRRFASSMVIPQESFPFYQQAAMDAGVDIVEDPKKHKPGAWGSHLPWKLPDGVTVIEFSTDNHGRLDNLHTIIYRRSNMH